MSSPAESHLEAQVWHPRHPRIRGQRDPADGGASPCSTAGGRGDCPVPSWSPRHAPRVGLHGGAGATLAVAEAVGEAGVAARVGGATTGAGNDVIDGAGHVVVRWERLVDVLTAEPAVCFFGVDPCLESSRWSALVAGRCGHVPLTPAAQVGSESITSGCITRSAVVSSIAAFMLPHPCGRCRGSWSWVWCGVWAVCVASRVRRGRGCVRRLGG